MAVNITFTPVKADGTLDTTVITLSGNKLPTNVEVQDSTTSISYNTALGQFVDFPIALKRKIMMKWDILSDAAIDSLYFDGLLSREKTNKRRFFKIAVSGDAELKKKLESISSDGIYYLGTPVNAKELANNKSSTYYSLELHFIQTAPYQLGYIPGA